MRRSGPSFTGRSKNPGRHGRVDALPGPWLGRHKGDAAMYVPLALLIVPFWAGVLPGGGLLGAMHVLMLPAM